MVTVDEDFVRCDGKSFAIRSITSVEVREQPLASRSLVLALGLALGVFGFFTLLWLLVAVENAMEFRLEPSDILLLIVLGFASFFLARATLAAVKRTRATVYSVTLATTAGEREAFVGPSPEEARDLQVLIEQAIAGNH
ncbi:MAG TPA: DUF6232 family protein [Sphingomicrobium sp.]|nr:DUF6232 family protein [Sphingomicrobium sp.]